MGHSMLFRWKSPTQALSAPQEQPSKLRQL